MRGAGRVVVVGVALLGLLCGLVGPVAAHPRIGPLSAVEDFDRLASPPAGVADAAPDAAAGEVGAPISERALPTRGTADALARGMGPAVLALLLVTLLAPPRPRRALALTLALVLGLLAFETGLHSVHHMGQDDLEARCAVASAAPHLTATDVGFVVVVPAPPPTGASLPAAEARSPHAPAVRFDNGRAPPAPLA